MLSNDQSEYMKKFLDPEYIRHIEIFVPYEMHLLHFKLR